MTVSQKDARHIFQSLRGGYVPERGLDAFAVGIERQRNEMHRLLDFAGEGESGLVKFLRGGYGCGKTFISKLTLLDARREGFATSFVVVSDNDLHFHKFSDVYRKVVRGLGTSSCPEGALGDILDRWIARIEDELISLGEDPDEDGFSDQVSREIASKLETSTSGAVPAEFVRVVQAIFEAKEEGEFSEAGALLSWLSGSESVAHSAKKRAQVKGDIEDGTALEYLKAILAIIRAAGYRGLVIAVDEVETILRMRRDVRGRSLNGIRQIVDAAGSYAGLLWVFTGTPEFFESKRGVASLPPLYDRIKFIKEGDFASSRQPQLELKPFDRERLYEVAVRLRELYPAKYPERIESKITDDFIENLVDEVTEGFAGDVGVVPRQFLRRFVNHLDLVEEEDEYDPSRVAGFEDDEELTPEEKAAMSGESAGSVYGIDDGDDDDLVAAEDVW